MIVTNPGEQSHLVLGRYAVLGLLGRGGMGSVYLGRVEGAAGFRRAVAIKLMHRHLMDDEGAVASFIREAKLAARLNHPNIVQVLDFGDSRGRFVTVLEYVRGYDLGQLARYLARTGRSISLDHAAFAVYKALRGLESAHELRGEAGEPLGIVHRDVSPQNILISTDGQVYLTDFGIARVRNEATLSQPGELKGKLAYMSPEQVFGKPADHRADIFAMGVVLYEVLSGQRLFLGESEAQTVMRVANAEIPDIRGARADLPDAVNQILARALAKDMNDRYDSAGLFAADVGHLMSASPDEIEPSFREMVQETFYRPDFVEAAGELPELTPALAGKPIRLPDIEPTPASDEPSLPQQAASQPTTTRKRRRARQTRLVVMLSVGIAAVVAAVAGVLLWALTESSGDGPDEPAQVAMVVQDRGGTSADAGPEATAPPPPPASPDGGPAPGLDALDGRTVSKSLLSHRAELLRCFESDPGGAPAKRVIIRLGIASDGTVRETSLEPERVQSTPTGRCLMGVTKAISFPRHPAEMLIFRVPLQVE